MIFKKEDSTNFHFDAPPRALVEGLTTNAIDGGASATPSREQYGATHRPSKQ